MSHFILRRLLSIVPILFGVSFLFFILMYLAPGDFVTHARNSMDVPVEFIEQQERQLGLVDANGDPTAWYVRYGKWLANISPVKWGPWVGKEDKGLYLGVPYFGESWSYKIPVLNLLAQRVPATFFLSLSSIIFAWVIAIPLGVLAAAYKGSIFDKTASLLAYAFLSIPEFFLAILAVYFASITGILPVGGRSSIDAEFMPPAMQFADYIRHLILPTIVLGIGGVAGLMRVMRANFIDHMHAEFVTTARAKGLKERIVLFKHVLRNAINPLISSLGGVFAALLGGSVLVENIMNYPGLGQLMYEALIREDQYVVMTGALASVTLLILGNIVADLALAWSDPRIRLESEENTQKTVSPRKILLFITILIACVVGEICFEALAAPSTIALVLKVLSYLLGAIVLVLALACIALMGYILFFVLRKLMKQILSRPLGFIAALLLLILYTCALLAPFLAPYDVGDQNLSKAFHPPTKLLFKDGRLQTQVYALKDASAAAYEAIEGETRPIKFFTQGHPYSFLGLNKIPALSFIPDMNTHFFQLESERATDRIYLLGSDSTGRDIFSRLLYGSQISLSIGLIGISITLVLGFLIGSLSGYYGGAVDFIIMRIVEFMMAIPGLYLLLTLRSTLIRPGMSSTEIYLIIITILSVIGWAGTARIIRGMTLSVRNRPFVLASESMGQPVWKILIKHILPNLSSYLLVSATLAIPAYILGEAALSFLGLGIQEPSASWGLMLKQSQEDMKVFFLNFWWMLTPGIAIFLTVVAFNIFGDVLRDVVDPKMKT